ncbi:MAG: SdrD B-like domain-containing protein, partial [Promethearchaeota archaeon]
MESSKEFLSSKTVITSGAALLALLVVCVAFILEPHASKAAVPPPDAPSAPALQQYACDPFETYTVTTWPTEAQWIPVSCEGVGDPHGEHGVGNGALDLVCSDPNAISAYYYFDEDFLYLRERVESDPSKGSGEGDEFGQFAWVVLLTPPYGPTYTPTAPTPIGSPTDYYYYLVNVNGLDDTIEIWKNNPIEAGIFEFRDASEDLKWCQDAGPVYAGPGGGYTNGLARYYDGTVNDGCLPKNGKADPDYFIEWAIPVSELITATDDPDPDAPQINSSGDLGLTCYFFATSAEQNNYNKDYLDCETCGPNAELAISKIVEPTTIVEVETTPLTYTIAVTNLSPYVARGVRITDTTIAAWPDWISCDPVTPTVTVADPTSGSFNTSVLSPWQDLEVLIDPLVSGDTVSITLSCTANGSQTAGEIFTNTSCASATNAVQEVCDDATVPVEAQPGALEVTKVVDWNGVTPDTTKTFEICIQGPSYPTAPGDCQTIGYLGGTLVWTDLIPGGYTVTETDPGPEWQVTITGTPATVVLGETASASVENVITPGTLEVVKELDPTHDPGLFNLLIDGTEVVTDVGHLGSTGPQNVISGTHTASETGGTGTTLTDYDTTYLCTVNGVAGPSGEGTSFSVDVAGGDTAVCTFTNTQQLGTIIVEKQTIPDGLPDTFTFSGDAAGTISDGQQIVVPSLTTGIYTSTEADSGLAFALTSIVCDDTDSTGDVGTRMATFNLQASETVTCVFTNSLQLPGTKMGVKFEDVNGNGAWDDGTDQPYDGWLIYLLDAAGAVAASTTTDPTGAYTFTVTPGQTYTICEELQTDWTQTYPTLAVDGATTCPGPYAPIGYAITLDPGQVDLDNDFGNYQYATKAGYKFYDSNGNGVWDVAEDELPLQGWEIHLDGTDGMGNAFNLAYTTDGTGYYEFNVPPGDYTVSEACPAGWYQSLPAPTGGVCGTGVYNITLISGQEDLDNDFGNYSETSKAGVKFHDLNANGVLDSGEPGFEGWEIDLYTNIGAQPTFVISTTTDATGAYTFSVTAGVPYLVCEVLQADWYQSHPDTGATCPNGTVGYDFTLQPGQVDLDNNFGNFQYATKAGYKFEDINANGVLDAGEPGLEGWEIHLDGTDGMGNAVNLTDLTDVNGYYQFIVPPGTYTVTEVCPDATWYQSLPAPTNGCGTGVYNIMLTSGQEEVYNDFGNYQYATKSGRKFYDSNRNGVYDVAEGELPLQGWEIHLDGTDGTGNAVNLTANTDEGGLYQFIVPPGTYTVTEVCPDATWFQTLPTPTDGCGTGVYNIALTSGQEEVLNDFGNYAQTTKAGVKFHDLNANGVNDGEPGLSGWTIYIDYNNSTTLDAGEPSATTGVDGTYTITGIDSGTWYVREVPQAGWICSYPNAGAGDADPVTGAVTSTACYHLVEFQPGGELTDNDFGNWTAATKSGTNFHDLNANGVNDGEPGLSGWTIYVDYNNSTTLDAGEPSATTGVDGTYTITGIDPGTWIVRAVLQNDWFCSSPDPCYYTEPFTSDEDVTGNDFGNYQYATKAGYKFRDDNANGVLDAGEPGLEGWEIDLYTNAVGAQPTFVISTTTDATGAYTFSVTAGVPYLVCEVLQADWYQSHPDTGATCPNGTVGYDFTLQPGQVDLDNNFGNFQNVDVTACKLEDVDGNPDTDADRVPVADWPVALTIDGVIVDEQLTLEDGCYTWTDLSPGSVYDVHEDLLPGWLAWTPTDWVFPSSQSGDSFSYTFTNSRLPTLEVVKELDPTDDPGLFNLLIDGTEVVTDVGHLGTTGRQIVISGTHIV